MRQKITLAALGLGLAATIAPLSPASAACSGGLVYAATGLCSPCDPVNAVLMRYGAHVDCFL